MLTESQKQPELESVAADLQSGDITVEGQIPELEYMYGCTVTAMAMMLGYYDLYGYQGYDLSDVIDGNVAFDSRGSDGNIYNKNEFDSVLGSTAVTQGHVDRFFDQTAAGEKKYTYIGGKVANGLNIDEWDCLADYIGTNQYWRGNGDLSTSHYFCDLAWLKSTGQTYYVGGENIPAKYVDYKYGLELYVQSKGYDLDDKLTYTEKVDTAGGSFTFKDYMAEIDAGRPVLISIVGHSMVGYGYNEDTKEIIFDDTYRQNQRMKWGGTYKYSGENRALRAITVIAFETDDLQQVRYHEAPQVVASTTALTNKNVILAVTFNKDAVTKEYSLDGKKYYKCSGTVSAAANGTYYFRSRAANGIYSDVGTYKVTNIDKTAPAKPAIKLSTSGLSYDPVTVTAVYTADSVKKLYSFDNKTWQDYTGSLTVNSNRTIYFRAADSFGNTVSSSYKVSNIVPLPPKTSPSLSGTAKKEQLSWSWQAQDVDRLTVSYQVKLNDKTIKVYGTAYQISKAAVGTHTLSVRAVYTGAGLPAKYSAWASKTLTVKDTVAPKIRKVAATVKGYSATLKISATDNGKIAKYVIAYGKKKLTSTSATATLTGLAVGKVAVSVVAYDAAGNKSSAKKVNLTVKDVTPPSKVVTLKNPSVTSKYKGTFSWSAAKDNSGKIARYEIQLDNGKIYKSTKTSVSISKLTVGKHTYRVRAIDKNKNVGAWSSRKSFTVKDMTAPSNVSVKVKVSGNNAVLTWKKPKDNVGVTKYILTCNGKTVTLKGSVTKYTITGLNKGKYSYSMVAVDAANNKSKAKTGKITIKQPLAPARAAEALYAADFAAPEALFAPQTDILAYCNDLQGAANLSDTAALTTDKKEERSLLAALS